VRQPLAIQDPSYRAIVFAACAHLV